MSFERHCPFALPPEEATVFTEELVDVRPDSSTSLCDRKDCDLVLGDLIARGLVPVVRHLYGMDMGRPAEPPVPSDCAYHSGEPVDFVEVDV
jgi:hypothetical protein